MPDKSLTIDLSASGGLSPRKVGCYSSFEDRTYLYIGAENQYADGYVNPITRLGYLSPSIAEITSINGTTTIEIIGATLADNVTSSLYFLERGSKIYTRSFNSSPASFKVVNTLTGDASIIGTDLEWYINNNLETLYYAYKIGTTAAIGTFTTSTGTWNNDWSYADASGSMNFGGNELKMVAADNGFMYVIDGNYIHKIDGSAPEGTSKGKIYPNVISFPFNFMLKDVVDSNGYLWVALTKTKDPNSTYTGTVNKSGLRGSGIYVWDRSSTITSPADYIPIDGIKDIHGLYSFQGGLACFTTSAANLSQLRLYNGKEFQVVAEYSGETRGYPQYHDAVVVNGDRMVWVDGEGVVWCYGKINPEGANILFKLGNMNINDVRGTGNTYGNSGAMLLYSKKGYNEQYYISLTDDAGKDILILWSPFGSGEGGYSTVYESFYYTLAKQLPKLSRLKEMTMYFPSKPLAGAITDTLEILYCDIYVNNASTTIKTEALTGQDRRKGYKRIALTGIDDVNCIQLGLRWKEGVTNQYTITPKFAELIFEPTTKKI